MESPVPIIKYYLEAKTGCGISFSHFDFGHSTKLRFREKARDAPPESPADPYMQIL